MIVHVCEEWTGTTEPWRADPLMLAERSTVKGHSGDQPDHAPVASCTRHRAVCWPSVSVGDSPAETVDPLATCVDPPGTVRAETRCRGQASQISRRARTASPSGSERRTASRWAEEGRSTSFHRVAARQLRPATVMPSPHPGVRGLEAAADDDAWVSGAAAAGVASAAGTASAPTSRRGTRRGLRARARRRGMRTVSTRRRRRAAGRTKTRTDPVRVFVSRVDLSGQLSNPSPSLLRLLRVTKHQVRSAVDEAEGPTPRQQQVRLSDTQRIELIQRHRQGAFKKELARAYGIHVETVRAIIRRAELQS